MCVIMFSVGWGCLLLSGGSSHLLLFYSAVVGFDFRLGVYTPRAYFFVNSVGVIFMREIDIVPDYLVKGLLRPEKSGEDSDRTAEQEVNSIWQRVDVGNMPVIVRSANRRNPRVRRTERRLTRGL